MNPTTDVLTSIFSFLLNSAELEESRARTLLLEVMFPTLLIKLSEGEFEESSEKLIVKILFAYFDTISPNNHQRYIEVSMQAMKALLHRRQSTMLNILCGLGITRFAKNASEAFRSVLVLMTDEEKGFWQTTMKNAVLMQSSASLEDDTQSSSAKKIDMSRYKRT
jgi:predicted HTH domain antitoxin